MALDEALLEALARLGRPVLRFYGWSEPAASFGYFQKFAEVERATLLRPLVRRPTGGGLVPHDADWTYTLAFPAGHAWYSLHAEESYRRAHEWIQSAFARLGVATELARESNGRRRQEAQIEIRPLPSAGPNQPDLCPSPPRFGGKGASLAAGEVPGQCFLGHEKFDLLWHGKKIAGAAQRRTRAGLLIQGSVQPPPLGLRRADWEAAMSAGMGGPGENFEPDATLRERSKILAAQKYSQTAFLKRR